MILGRKYKHGEGDLATTCNIDLKKLQAKQKVVNKYIVDCNKNKDNKFYRSQVVKKMEELFTKRELAFLTQQYSEVLQAKINSKPKSIDYDPAICFTETCD